MNVLTGQTITPEVIAEAANVASQKDISPTADIHASVEYRRKLAHTLTYQILTQALERAKGAGKK
jgi:CO/xanthine dehydrogenase FAD-binding subunit